MGASVILAWSYLPYQLSIILFLVIARNIYSYINREFVFGSASYSLKATAVAIFVFLPVIPLMVIRGIEIETNLIVAAFINASFFGVVFEEFLFRGLLWKMLKDLGFTERKIIATQAFLFWMAHYHLLLSGSLSFWITIPIISLMLGIVISKSKSLGLSISAHFLYNFFIGFIILK